ncbi:MAG TPA: zinc ABC transporter substrate-binding protein [Nitrososphaeraceae archaeon]|nr:zinc ABC transporter substrate-binding protein [Nitrososphaeraceae archaeon]
MNNIIKLLNEIVIVVTVTAILSSVFAINTIIIHATNNAASEINNTIASINGNKASKVKVVASFYPIYDFVQKIGGDRVEVSSIIPPGVEPHDWEPTIQQRLEAESSDMIVYNGAGFEKWIEEIDAKFRVDTSEGLELLEGSSEGGDHQTSASGHTDLNENADPHIWLDPILAKYQIEKIRDGLIKIDPANTNYYNGNAKKFIAELDSLDAFIRSELSNCDKIDFIAFHNAFTYFSNRYGLNQHSVYGVSPEGDILPQRLQEIIKLSRELNIDTIYAEDLIDPRLVNVIATEIPNGKVLILSPIEGIDKEEQKAGKGYIDKMRQNIENLKVGLRCT